MELRPYQRSACNAVIREWNTGHRKTLLVLPTGTGKTIVFSKITEHCVKAGYRVLILAHRDELLQQAADKLKHATGLGCAMEKASLTSIGSSEPVTVGSVQSMMREKRLHKFPSDYFGMVIVDEAHHAVSNSYKKVLGYFSRSCILGVTATPDRSDRKSLGTLFDSLAFEYTLPQAIKEGYLCRIIAQTVPLAIDISHVEVVAGDFKSDELGSALEPFLDKIADNIVSYCKDRKTVVFLPLVSLSKRFCAILNQKGVPAAEINGYSENRSEVLRDFEAGKYKVLCNAMLLTEGWDCPSVDCIVCLRATKSRSLYSQIVGRGLRPFPGKKDCLLLDFLWQIEKHRLVHPADILAKSEEVSQRMTNKLKNGKSFDLEELETVVQHDIVSEREQALQEELMALRNRKGKQVDLLQYEMSIQDESLVNYSPSFAWESRPASVKQMMMLEKFGISSASVKTAGKASVLLSKLIERRKLGFSSPKQIRYLESKGFKHVGNWSFEDASSMISLMSRCKWKVPDGIDVDTYVPV